MLSRGEQMLIVMREVYEASRREGEPVAQTSDAEIWELDLVLLTALAEEAFDPEAVMERLVADAYHD